MPAFDNYAADAAQVEAEIARKGVVLGIDWNDHAEVRAIAKQALTAHIDTLELKYPANSPKGMAMLEIVALSQLMLRVLRESGDDSIINHGGPIWKALGRELWDQGNLSRGRK